MNSNETVNVLKAFYFGCESMEKIARRTKISRDEVREILRGARSCGLIKYSTKDNNEVFVHVERKKLGEYLKAKGLLRQESVRPYQGKTAQKRPYQAKSNKPKK